MKLQLFQVVGENDLIPLATSALGEVNAAETVDRYPGADYHFFYANMELKPLEYLP